MIKVTGLFGHPVHPTAFEEYFAASHAPLVAKMPGVVRHEDAKVMGTPTGDKPPYHRIFEAWFENETAFGAAMGSPEGRAVVADLANFATGGLTILVSAVD
jgi:uncharacterized protein (TIGR02118 family)